MLQKVAATASSFYHFLMGSSGTEASAPEAIRLPTMEETRSLCLKVYLEKYYAALQSAHVVQLFNVIQDILHIYDCLYSPIIHTEKSRLSSDAQEWKCSQLKHVRTILV